MSKKLGLGHLCVWISSGSTDSKVSVGEMGCGDKRDIFAARRPIRTQRSVSFPRRIPDIKAPARLPAHTDMHS